MSTEGFEDIKPEASDLEIYRLKTEISALNKSVQHGTDLNHDDIERKVLENENRIHELEKESVVPVESTSSAPEPTPEIPPITPELTPEVPLVIPAPEIVLPVPPTPEVIPTASTPEAISTTPSTPEVASLDRYRFSPDNRGLWEKMKGGGKKILNDAYEKVHGSVQDMPRTTTLIGKMKIAFNQFWVERHENKAVKIKSKADGLDIRINSINKNQEDSRKLIEDFKRTGAQGSESLEVGIRDGETKKIKLQGKKDVIQSKFEARDNKRKIWIEKRNVVAGKLIGYFENKLNPIESRLEASRENLNSVGLDIAVMEAKHADSQREIKTWEQLKDRQSEIMRRDKKSEGEIRTSVGVLEEQINIRKKQLQKESDEIKKEQIRISEEIAKQDKKANPLRDKREIFVRAKNNRGINVSMETRTKGTETTEHTSVEIHTRTEAASEAETTEPSSPETTPESIEAVDERPSVEAFATAWNTVLNENRREANQQLNIDAFAKDLRINKNQKMTLSLFKNILSNYYKTKKIPAVSFNQDIMNLAQKLK